MSDLETLEALNRDYISSVQNGDVRRLPRGRSRSRASRRTTC
jgi:hypothetical protein